MGGGYTSFRFPEYDFIYGADINTDDLVNCLKELKKRLNNKTLSLSDLRSDSKLLSALKLMDNTTVSPINKVNIFIGDDYEAYYKRLTKHVRQNIRTAYNRLEKDGHIYSLKSIIGEKIDTNMFNSIMDVYFNRRVERYSLKISKLKRIWMRLFDFATAYMRRWKQNVFFVLYIDGKIAAFMSGIMADECKRIIIPRLAIDDEYSRYSPGYILINESAKVIANDKTIENLDLMVGTEQYKFDMGGETYNTYKVVWD